MAYAKQATGAFGEDLQWLTQDALMLRDTFGLDVTESLRGADSLMQQFGQDGTTAMAMLAEAMQKGLDKNGDLVDTVEEYSVYFKAAGMDAQDMFGILENASKAGVRNLDYVGDAMKEFGIIMKEDGDKATNALNGLGLNAGELRAQFAKGGEGAKEAFQVIMGELGKIEDPLKRNQLGVELFGTKFEDLEADAILAMSNVKGTITGSVDTLNAINEIKYDSFGEALQGIGRNLMMGVFEPFQAKVMPIMNEFANWISERMPQIEEFATTTFNAIFSVTGKVYNFFKDNILPILTQLYDWFQANMPTIRATGESTFGKIKEVTNTMWAFFKEHVLPIFVSLYEWIQSNMPTIKATAKAVFDEIKDAAAKVWEFYKAELLPIFAALYSWVQERMPTIQTIVEKAFKIISNVVSVVWKIFKEDLMPILKALWDWIEPTFPKIGSVIGNTFDTVISIVEGVIDVFERVSGAIKTAIDWLHSFNDTEAEDKNVGASSASGGIIGGIPNNYVGDPDFQGGLSWVGEHGPELVNLPKGTRIHSANDSRQMAAKGDIIQNITINSTQPLTPSEVARKTLQVSRQLAMEWGI